MRFLVAALVAASIVAPRQSVDQRVSLNISAAARAIQPGEVVVLTITTSRPVAALHVRAFERELWPFAENSTTWRVLVGIDLEVPSGKYSVAITAGEGVAQSRAAHVLLVQPKTFQTRKLTVDPAFVNPPADVQPRIQSEAARLARVWGSPSKSRFWNGQFVRPVGEAANSAFGSRSVFNGQARNPHSGADFASPAGTPVRSPNAGRVALAGDLYFTGNTVVLDHGLGLFSLFAHLESIDVREGDSVVAGQFLGNVGATGRVTGPHLHWTVRLNDARVDPLALLSVLGASSR